MRAILMGLFLMMISVSSFAQEAIVEQEIKELSKTKWQWMADKDVDQLESLFHEKSKFVHMSGSWKKDRELVLSKQEAFGTKKQMCTMWPLRFLVMTPPSFGTESL